MGCGDTFCGQEKAFIFINIAFAMYSGALLATAARLAWDPSTYAWLRFLCAAQYRVSAGYVLAAGAWLAGLVYLAAAAAAARRQPARRTRTANHCLHLYVVGVVGLFASEVAYGAWMAASLAAWWRSSAQAQLARRAADLIHDLKPALLAMERYRDLAHPLYHMIEEMEQQAPNNVYVIIIFALIGFVLQIAAVVMARRLARGGGREPQLVDEDEGEKAEGARGAPGVAGEKALCVGGKAAHDVCCDDLSEPEGGPGWRKQANLRMYTILDKIF